MKLWRNYIFLGVLPSLKCRQFKRVILMGRIPRLKWLVPRFVLVLLFVACVQLIAYMGVIPSTLQNTDVLCNCQSAVSECATSNDETTENFSKDKAPVTSSVRKNFEQKQSVEEQLSKRKSTDHGEEEKAKAHLQDLNRLGKELKQLAKDMVETQRDVVKFATIYHRLGRHISSVNSLLHSIKHPPVDVNQNVLGKRTLNSDKTMKNVVCPEKFLGKDLSVGYPWFRKGFATENCTHSTPMRKLITVLLHIHEQLPKPAKDLVTLVKSLGKQYPGVEIVIATSRDEPRLKNLSSTLTNSLKLRIFSKNHQGQVWSSLLNDVVTPFVFSATDLTHFDDDIDFVRLIRVLSNSEEVVIAGGGYRNQKGLWDIGCLQTSFRNWTMSFRGGYYQSSGDCLACDYLEGPWVGKTEVLKKIGFDKGLEKGAFHDMFWRIKKALPGNIAVSCPDIMFNIHTNPVPDSYYVQLASKWEIKKWVDASGQVRWYGCRRGFQHNIGTQSCAMSKGVANPPCDLENFADAIKFLMKECEDAGLFCELQEGTLLGAVKFNKVLPWERDADITFLTANYTALKKLRPKFVEQGYTLSDDDDSLWCCVDGRQAGGKFTVGTSRFTIEMYGQHMMESELLVASGQSPTKVQFAGQWVNVVRNPGLYARNRYGPNHFRHAEHWMDLGQGTGWEFYHPGTFSACPYPNHSACLDQYPADGNIQFSDYTSK